MDIENTIKELQREVVELKEKILMITNRSDLTSGGVRFEDDVMIKDGNYFVSGGAALTSDSNQETNSIFGGLIVGKQPTEQGGDTTKNFQLVIEHKHGTDGTTNDTFVYGVRPPTYIGNGDVTSGGNTMVQSNFSWTTNELAGAYINIFNSSGTFVFTKPIASNTSTTITITGTWPSSVSNGTFSIYVPVYFGSSQTPWRRLYTGESTSEGIRFGYGPTAGGQNGLLYMDSAGDLYWRNKSGTSTKLNV